MAQGRPETIVNDRPSRQTLGPLCVDAEQPTASVSHTMSVSRIHGRLYDGHVIANRMWKFQNISPLTNVSVRRCLCRHLVDRGRLENASPLELQVCASSQDPAG
jgi:hypothetical protein